MCNTTRLLSCKAKSGLADGTLENIKISGVLWFFIEDIPLCLMSYKTNKLFIAGVKHDNIFSVRYFNGVMFRSFLLSSGYLKET